MDFPLACSVCFFQSNHCGIRLALHETRGAAVVGQFNPMDGELLSKILLYSREEVPALPSSPQEARKLTSPKWPEFVNLNFAGGCGLLAVVNVASVGVIQLNILINTVLNSILYKLKRASATMMIKGSLKLSRGHREPQSLSSAMKTQNRSNR